MAFRVKDLMINSLPQDSLTTGENMCHLWSLVRPFPVLTTPYTCGGSGATTNVQFLSPAATVEALEIIKAQLKEQLALVEVVETAIEGTMLPKTVEEVDSLINKLNEAVVELKTQRDALEKKPGTTEEK